MEYEAINHGLYPNVVRIPANRGRQHRGIRGCSVDPLQLIKECPIPAARVQNGYPGSADAGKVRVITLHPFSKPEAGGPGTQGNP